MASCEADDLISLLENALTSKNPAVHIRRLWTMREPLTNIYNLNEPTPNTSETSKISSLLHQCIASPAFLKNEQGKKFLALLFELDSIPLIHEKFKQLLPKCSNSKASQYGDIYFRAWKAPVGDNIRQLEKCIQDLMYFAVHARDPLASTLRHMLQRFTDEKNNRQVERMLSILLQPIIWRALDAINSEVRLNAAQLFFVVFPLRIPDSCKEENGILYERQLAVVKDLLNDKCPVIRQAAAIGSCNICYQYWEQLPLDFLKSVICNLKDLSADISSPDVRVGVYKGVRKLLEQPAAGAVLNKLLQKVMPNNLHDTSDKVRFQVAVTLVQLRGLKVLKFWEIVNIEDILSRLAVEKTHQVCEKLVELLFPSYCPISKSLDQRLQRTATLIKQNEKAARTFYAFCGKMMSIQEAVEQVMILLRSLHSCVKLSKARNENDDKNGISDIGDISAISGLDIKAEDCGIADASETTLMAGLTQCAAILFTAISKDLQMAKNDRYREKLYKFSGLLLPAVIAYFKDNWLILDGLYVIGSLLPDQHAKYLCKSVLKSLESLEIENCVLLEKHVQAMLQVACAWKFPDLFEKISEWLDSTWKGVTDKRNTSISRGPKRVKFAAGANINLPKPGQGLLYLLFLLDTPSCRIRILNECGHLLPQLIVRLEKAKYVTIKFLQDEKEISKWPGLTPDALVLFFKTNFQIHLMTAIDPETIDSSTLWITELTKWTRTSLIIYAIAELSESQKSTFNSILHMIFEGLSVALLTGLYSENLMEELLICCGESVTNDGLQEFLPDVLSLVYQMAEASLCSPEALRTSDLICPLVERSFRCLGSIYRKLKTEDSESLGTKCIVPLRDVLVSVCVKAPLAIQRPCRERLVNAILAAILIDLSAVNSKEDTVEDPTSSSFECPPLTNLLFNSILGKQTVLLTVIAECLVRIIENRNGFLSSVYILGAATQLVALMNKKKVSSNVLNRIKQELKMELEELNEEIKETEGYKQAFELCL